MGIGCQPGKTRARGGSDHRPERPNDDNQPGLDQHHFTGTNDLDHDSRDFLNHFHDRGTSSIHHRPEPDDEQPRDLHNHPSTSYHDRFNGERGYTGDLQRRLGRARSCRSVHPTQH